MEALQNLLTIAIESTVLLGFGGIALHAIWKQHTNWMTAHCPPVKPYKSEAPAPVEKPQEVVKTVEVNAAPETEVKEEQEVEVIEEVLVKEPTAIAQPEISFSALDTPTLRKLCTNHQIVWKNVRGKSRHATKAMMVFQLEQRLQLAK